MINLSVRQQELSDIDNIVDYFLKSKPEFLTGMGVDLGKLPSRYDWIQLLTSNFNLPNKEKKFYYLIWILDGLPIGHCNINKIVFGEEAYMHLHVWNLKNRKQGLGLQFVKQSIPHFFNQFGLQKLYCEPYSLNPGPNKILEKLGFVFEKSYETVPGWINFRQVVNSWYMKVDQF